MADPVSITCGLTIEYLDKQQSVTRTAKWRTSTLTLVRNEFREIYLDARVTDSNLRFLLQNISVHKKFVSEGKATIHFQLHPAKLYISNAPASQLIHFLKTIFVKMSSFKSSPKVPLREQLLSNKGRQIEEISPINVKDVTRLKAATGVSVDAKRAPKKSVSSSNKAQAVKKRCVESLLTEKLTDEQQRVVDAVTLGHNIFFTGSAGTGKSFLLRHIIGALAPDKTVATASTGAAACLISGTTLHSFAGIGSGESTLERSVQLAQRPQVLSNWKRCKHLIIDEISMVDGKYFEKVEKVARIVKGVDKPFGGIQLIVCGDFLQLPPVVQRGFQGHKFCFQFPVWKDCDFRVYNLVKVHRQNDTKFIDILNNIRIGKVTDEMSQILVRTASQIITKDNIVATKLCSHNQEATSINNAELNRLAGVERKFEAEDSSATARKLLDDQTPVEAVLVLKAGAQVMLLKNVNIARGLVNGARGVITKFSKDGLPVVRFMSGVECTVPREKWIAKSASGTHYVRKQIPLKLAWAFSIHKSQGLTLDCVEISLSKVFEAGQAYVALSRAKGLDSLRIIDFDPKQVWADKDVLNFYHKEAYKAKLFSRQFIPLGPKRK